MSVTVEVKLSAIYPQQEAKQTKKNKEFFRFKGIPLRFQELIRKKISFNFQLEFVAYLSTRASFFINYFDNLHWNQCLGPGTMQMTENGMEQRSNYLFAPTMGRQTIVHKQCFLKEGMEKNGGAVE